MAFDIPNYLTLMVEVGVAFMILWVDRSSRHRDQQFIIQRQAQEARQREANQAQIERFNNWTKEAAKRQIMLLESIMASMGEDRADVFKEEVGSRYSQELSDDLDDLQDLLDKKQQGATDKTLDTDIESKIDELSSASEIARNFVPENILESIKNISQIAKTSLTDLKEYTEDGKVNFNLDKTETDQGTHYDLKPNVADEEGLELFSEKRNQIDAEIEKIKLEIAKGVSQTTEQLGSKLKEMFTGGGIEKGIKGLVNLGRGKAKEDNSPEEGETKEDN